jgi:hypothetical protein
MKFSSQLSATVKVAILSLLVLMPTASGQQRSARRDWAKQPAVVEVDTPTDVYALGDVHGDYERLVSLLVAAKLIPADPGPPEKVRWQADKAVLVCTGDFIDKWTQSLRVIALLRALQSDAASAGGRVIVTLGNHEAEFLADPRNRKAAEFIKEMEERKIVPEQVAAGADPLGIGQWLRGLPAAARVNDWFFAHAGKTDLRTLAQLQEDLRTGIERDGFKTRVLQAEDSIVLARMSPRPWWEAEGDSAAQSKEKLNASLAKLGVRHLVIGHAPAKIVFADKGVRDAGDLAQHFDGLFFMIDTGMSRAVNYSPGAILKIHATGDRVIAERIAASGRATQIWSGKKVN